MHARPSVYPSVSAYPTEQVSPCLVRSDGSSTPCHRALPTLVVVVNLSPLARLRRARANAMRRADLCPSSSSSSSPTLRQPSAPHLRRIPSARGRSAGRGGDGEFGDPYVSARDARLRASPHRGSRRPRDSRRRGRFLPFLRFHSFVCALLLSSSLLSFGATLVDCDGRRKRRPSRLTQDGSFGASLFGRDVDDVRVASRRVAVTAIARLVDSWTTATAVGRLLEQRRG